MLEILKKIVRKFQRIIENTKKRGLTQTFVYLWYKLSINPVFLRLRQSKLNKQLDEILMENEGRPIILSLSFIDWKVPLYQRPQHIAIQLAKKGFLYFYNTRNYFDFMDGYKKIGENMYLTNRFDDVYEKLKDKKKYIHLYSTNMYEDDEKRLEKALRNRYDLYEYIDEISEDIW